jgi:predicted transposase YdaD
MNHDRLFKELLTVFFVEFLWLFFPRLAAELDPDAAVVPLDKEVFTDVTQCETHEVDLVMRAKLRGEDAFFLIHVESQSTPQSGFPRRMFHYFARLTEKYDLPVYPIVIFSYDTPTRPEPDHYTVAFPDLNVLQFRYRVIQLNRLPWRRFVRQENPVASALMAKMKMLPSERPRVKLECLRLLASLRLDPAKARLIGGFVESYLRLSAQEMAQYERALAALEPAEKEATMEVLTYWEERGLATGRQEGRQEGQQEGRQEGRQQGKEALVARLLRRRLGSLPAGMMARLEKLSPELLDDLGEALLDFTSMADLDSWLARR